MSIQTSCALVALFPILKEPYPCSLILSQLKLVLQGKCVKSDPGLLFIGLARAWIARLRFNLKYEFHLSNFRDVHCAMHNSLQHKSHLI